MLPPTSAEPNEASWDEVFANVTQKRQKLGSIHIEFSYASVYPRPFLALAIAHEATHKFADTNDYATTDDTQYKRLTQGQRVQNADSFAYTVLSLHTGQVIKDLKMALQVIPRPDPTFPPTFKRNAAHEV